MEEQITGFSVGVDNLWLNEDDRLSVINSWEDGPPIFTGPLGLCSLIIQLSSGSTQIPDPFTALDNYLLQIDLLQASAEQKSALIKLVRRAYYGQASLSSLVIGLQGLLHIKNQFEKIQAVPVTEPVHAAIPISRNQAQQPAAIPYNLEIIPPETEIDEEEETHVPFYKRKFAVVLGLIFAAFLIWMIWPSAQTPKNPVDSSPPPSNQSSTVPSATPVPTPTKDNSVIGPGQDTTVPNLVGMKRADAEQQAKSSGLHYEFFIEVHAESESGTVFKQDPAADTKAVKGDKVTFWVSK
jgi:serine/threonine-protein kinase